MCVLTLSLLIVNFLYSNTDLYEFRKRVFLNYVLNEAIFSNLSILRDLKLYLEFIDDSKEKKRVFHLIGLLYLKNNNFDSAIVYFEKTEENYLIDYCLLKLGRIEKAHTIKGKILFYFLRGEYEKVIKLPDSFPIIKTLSFYYLGENDSVIRRVEDDTTSIGLLLKCFVKKRKPTKGERRKLLPFYEEEIFLLDILYYIKNQKFQKAIAEIEKWKSKYPESLYESEREYLEGLIYFYKKKYGKAAEKFINVKKKLGLDFEKYINIFLAKCYFEMGMYDFAILFTKKVLSNPEMLYIHAVSLFKLGKYKKSLSFFERLKKFSRWYRKAIFYEVLSYAKLSDYEKSLNLAKLNKIDKILIASLFLKVNKIDSAFVYLKYNVADKDTITLLLHHFYKTENPYLKEGILFFLLDHFIKRDSSDSVKRFFNYLINFFDGSPEYENLFLKTSVYLWNKGFKDFVKEKIKMVKDKFSDKGDYIDFMVNFYERVGEWAEIVEILSNFVEEDKYMLKICEALENLGRNEEIILLLKDKVVDQENELFWILFRAYEKTGRIEAMDSLVKSIKNPSDTLLLKWADVKARYGYKEDAKKIYLALIKRTTNRNLIAIAFYKLSFLSENKKEILYYLDRAMIFANDPHLLHLLKKRKKEVLSEYK